jgi:integrase
MLKIPAGQERCGIKINCQKCDRNIKEICPLTKHKISTCKFKSSHKYKLIYHVPATDNARITKIIDTKNFSEAVVERAKYKIELEKKGYHKIMTHKTEKIKTNLFDLTIEYLNVISGESSLELLNRVRSKGHVRHIKLVLGRFSDCMIKKGYSIKKLDLKDIGDIAANDFLIYLKNYSDSKDLQMKHFVIMKTFFNWVIEVKEYKVSNPFRKAELRFDTDKEVQVISRQEFDSLLKVVTFENGFQKFKENDDGKEKGKNLYRDYLINAFKLSLETGCRGEELTVLKWSHLKTIENGAELFYITNLKVTRIQASKNKKIYKRPIPVTNSLKKLLLELGYNSKKGKDEYVLVRPANVSELHMAKIIGRAFNHYITLIDTGGRKIEFKDLRKTYITFITLALGSNAKIFTGHADEKVLQDHYLSKQFIAGNLTNFDIFAGNNKTLNGALSS